MKLFESMTRGEALQPFLFDGIGMEAYSLEGFIYICRYMGSEGWEIFSGEAAGAWLRTLPATEKVYETWLVGRDRFKVPQQHFAWFMRQFPVFGDWLSDDAEDIGGDIKNKAREAYQSGAFSSAVSLYRRALENAPDPVLYHNLALCFIHLNLYEAAEDMFNKGASMQDRLTGRERNAFMASRIRFLLLQGRCREALDSMDPSPSDPELLGLRGDLLLAAGDRKEAFRQFVQAYETGGQVEHLIKALRNGMLDHTMEEAMQQIEHYKGALGGQYPQMVLEAAMHFDPESVSERMAAYMTAEAGLPELYLTMSRFYRERHQLIKAIEALKRGVQLWEMDDDFAYEMARVAKQAGNYEAYMGKIDAMLAGWKRDIRRQLDAL